MKKRSFSLLEVIIAASIVAMMTLFAISQLKGFVTLKHTLHKESKRALDLSYFSLKLKLLLEENYLCDFASSIEPSPEISFTFKKDPLIAPKDLETMWGALSLKGQELKFSLYAKKPDEETFPLKEELFLQNVENILYTFYKYDEGEQKFTPLSQWDPSEKSPPHLISLQIFFYNEKKPHTLTFFLPAYYQLQFVI